MRKTLSITIIFCLLLTLLAPLGAQNTPIGSLDRYGLLMKKDNLLQTIPQEPYINSVEPGQIELTEDAVMNYERFAAVYNKPLSQLIDNERLFYEYQKNQDLNPEVTTQAQILPNNTNVDHAVFDKLYNPPRVDEKRMLREEWKRVFGGVDVWYPYFKAKEVEEWVKERMSVRLGKFKGKPQFDRGKILYVLKSTF